MYDERVISTYSQFLSNAARRLSSRSNIEDEDAKLVWPALESFIDLLITSPRFNGKFFGPHPLSKLSVPLTLCIRAIACKYAPLRHARFESESKISLVVATLMLFTLREIISEPFWAIKVLDAGILKAIFRSCPYFFQGNVNPGIRSSQYVEYAGGIFKVKSRLLLFPQVLRRFLREVRQIEASVNMVAQLRAKSPTLVDLWMKMKEKAFKVQQCRQELQARLFFHYCSREGVRDI